MVPRAPRWAPYSKARQPFLEWLSPSHEHDRDPPIAVTRDIPELVQAIHEQSGHALLADRETIGQFGPWSRFAGAGTDDKATLIRSPAGALRRHAEAWLTAKPADHRSCSGERVARERGRGLLPRTGLEVRPSG